MTRHRRLHPKERSYVMDAACGYTVKQTAARYGVTVNTVNHSLKNAKDALGAATIAHAVAIAIACGEFTVTDLSEEEDDAA